MTDRRDRAWGQLFRLLLGAPKPLVRALWRLAPGAPLATVVIVGRRSGKPRTYLLSILEADGQWYVGHPNGQSQWSRNLARAGTALVERRGTRTKVSALELPDGPERDAAIGATDQQPFGASVLYRRGRGHVRRFGSYFRLDPVKE